MSDLTPDHAQYIRARWNAQCIHTVGVEIVTDDEWGKETPGPRTDYPCRVVYRAHEVRTAAGTELTSAGWIAFAFPGPPTLGTADRIILPNTSTPPILSVESDPDPVNGIKPTTVHF
jgi:hypothetical protein